MPTDRELAFPQLSARHIAELKPRGTVRAVAARDVLFSGGDRDFAFSVVLSGDVEIVEHSSGETRVIAVHGPGEFTADVDMMSGRGALVAGRVRAAGEVLVLSAAELRRVVNDLSEIGEVLLRAFLTRRTLLLDGGFEGIKIVGSRYSPAAHVLRDFATRNGIPHTWLDLEGCVALDAKGFVLTGTALDASVLSTDAWCAANRAPFFLATSLPGVFAAGDARSGSIKRVASAVGEGSIAISFVHTHLGVSA